MVQFIKTSSDAYLQRHRDVHARHPAFGTHKHPYLRETVRGWAEAIAKQTGELPSLLDYGCGKGVFLKEMTRLKLFRFHRGYDPAITIFEARPAQSYDVVTCLDVLDQLEDGFVDAVIRDVAQLTARVAIFDIITQQVARLEHLNPRSPQGWGTLVSAHMDVSALTVRRSTAEEIAQGAAPERVIITATPPGGGTIAT